MKHTIMTLTMVALVAAAFSAPLAGKDAKKSSRGFQETDVDKQTYEVGKNARLSLSNLNGGVTVTGWDKNEFEVIVTKRAGSRAQLDDANVQVDVNGDYLHIEVEYDFDNDGEEDETVTFDGDDLVDVDFEIRAPRHAEIRRIELVNGGLKISDLTGDVNAASVNGNVSGEELSGETHLSTVNGNVKLSSVTKHDEIELSSVNGSVTLYLPKNVNAKLTASTVHGDIRGDLGHGVTHAGSSMDAVLGTGGPRIELGTVNGDIRIRRAGSEKRDDSDDDSD